MSDTMFQLSPKSLKILTLALNDAAPDGEWQAAAIRFISGLRNEKTSPERFIPAPTPSVSHASYKMPFGQYKGMPIAAVDDGYLIWMAETMTMREPLKSIVKSELERRGL